MQIFCRRKFKTQIHTNEHERLDSENINSEKLQARIALWSQNIFLKHLTSLSKLLFIMLNTICKQWQPKYLILISHDL